MSVKVEVVMNFGNHKPGELHELTDETAKVWIDAGWAQRLGKAPPAAVDPPKKRRGRPPKNKSRAPGKDK